MEITLKSRNGKLTEEQRLHLEHKLRKLARYLEENVTVHVDLSRAQERGSGEVHTVQATLTSERGMMIRAEERNHDLFAAVDILHDSLQRQITRYKDRHYRRGRNRHAEVGMEFIADGQDGTSSGDGGMPGLVKTKQFVYKPMDADEAIEQMELLGHDFFVFVDAGTNLVNVVYRRRDGNYGLIEQEKS